jgi:phosphoribosylformylglycinamidine synthase
MRAPVSLIVSAFAPVADVRNTFTPQLRLEAPSRLLLVDLGAGRNRLGATALAQAFSAVGDVPADLDEPGRVRALFNACRALREREILLAYHDRSDGGLFTTLCEMAFASRCGLDLDIPGEQDALAFLFNEELGAVLQVPESALDTALSILRDAGLHGMTSRLGQPSGEHNELRISRGGEIIYMQSRAVLQTSWGETSYRLQALRDNPECAEQEFLSIADDGTPGLYVRESFDRDEDIAAPYVARGERPRMAILREQGVNGHVEMAAAFDRAGFTAIDLHMSDIVAGRLGLDEFKGLVACGGFSYGDVLGAGGGWAKTILHNTRARDAFAAFFARTDSFALGVCNGCQMFAHLKSLIPGAQDWPDFLRNRSEQFEARLSMVRIEESPSVLLRNMQGSCLPVAVAHGEGQAYYAPGAASGLVALRYVDHHGGPTESYPSNPNGSAQGITGLSNADGRVTIMMPHPERLFRGVQYSWHPDDWGEDGPWLRLFRNARVWVD